MEVNSTGDRNRAAGRDFNENKIQIDRLETLHTINIAIPSEKKDERPLVKAQRIELNKLVAAVVESGAGEPYEVWQRLHAEIGVSGIDEMTVNQYPTAVSFLHAMRDRAKEKDSNRALVHILMKNTPDSVSRQRLIHYCHIQFATGRFNDLTAAQLRQAIAWVDDRQVMDFKTLSPQSGWSALFRTHQKEVLVLFVVGVVLGAIVF